MHLAARNTVARALPGKAPGTRRSFGGVRLPANLGIECALEKLHVLPGHIVFEMLD